MDKKTTRRLLAIDDEAVILEAVKRVCTAEGWHVDVAPDALQGLQMVRKSPYDLCLCDIKLPDLDGFEFLDKLREMNSNLAVIMTTGFATVENAVKSLDKGAIDYLPKPFTVDEILSTLYRGFRYVKLIAKQNDPETELNALIVPCPTKYRLLGYGSWLFIEYDGSVKIGATDLFVKVTSPIKSISFEPLEAEIIQGFSSAELESEDELVHQLMAPISGQIIKVNDKLKENPSLLEKDPYFDGWFYVIIPKNLNYEMKYLSVCRNLGPKNKIWKATM